VNCISSLHAANSLTIKVKGKLCNSYKKLEILDKLDKGISTAVVSSHNASNKTTTHYTKKNENKNMESTKINQYLNTRRSFGLKQ